MGGSLVGGYFAAKAISESQKVRLALSFALGPALLTAWTTLSSFVAPSRIAAVLGLALTLVVGILAGRETEEKVAPAPRLARLEWFVLGLALVATWLAAVGGQQLFPDENYLLWGLPKFSTWSQSVIGSGFLAVSGLFGMDPFASALWGSGVLQVLGALSCFLFCFLHLPDRRFLRALCFLYLLLSTGKGFLILASLDQSLLHLWAGASLLVLPLRSKARWFVVLWSAAALPLSSPLALALILTFVPRNKRFWPFFLVAGALWALLMKGLSFPWILALLFLKWWGLDSKEPLPNLVRTLAILELWGPGWGVFSLTALALVIARWLLVQWDRAGSKVRPTFGHGELLLPKRLLLGLGLALLLVAGVKPGETVFNDDILIGSHKEDIELVSLFWPHSLTDWLKWRGERFGFGDRERAAAKELATLEGSVAYLSGPVPEPIVSALISSTVGTEMRGWKREEDGPALLPEIVAYLQSDDPQFLTGSGLVWVVGPGQQTTKVGQAGAAPGNLKVSPLETTLVSPNRSLPASSLIPIELTLTNTSSYPQTSRGVSGARFLLDYRSGYPLRPLLQPITPVALPPLAPGGQAKLTVVLRTPPRPSNFDLKLVLVAEDGHYRETKTASQANYRTWSTAPPHAVPPQQEGLKS